MKQLLSTFALYFVSGSLITAAYMALFQGLESDRQGFWTRYVYFLFRYAWAAGLAIAIVSVVVVLMRKRTD